MEENFDSLKKLLALKRHEQPPPGYFNTFSSKVLARIQAGEAAAPKTWWQRLMSFNARPVMAGVYGVTALLMAGFILAVASKPPGTTSQPLVTQKPNVAQPQVNEGNASMPLENEPNSNIILASNDSAPSFLFSPNGVFDSNSQFKTMPAGFKQNAE
jgi:hypothetical protein